MIVEWDPLDWGGASAEGGGRSRRGAVIRAARTMGRNSGLLALMSRLASARVRNLFPAASTCLKGETVRHEMSEGIFLSPKREIEGRFQDGKGPVGRYLSLADFFLG